MGVATMNQTSSLDSAREPALIYHAITGIEGRELTGFLHRVFVVVQDENYELGGLPTRPQEIHPIDPHTLSAIKLFTFRGHGLPREVTLRGTYPEFFQDPRFLVMTFIADPLRSAAHAYGWYAAQDDGRPKMSFAEFLRGRKPNLYADALQCRWWNWRSVLGKYFFLGVHEESVKSLAVLGPKIEREFARRAQTPNVARARYFLSRYLANPETADAEASVEIDARVRDLSAGEVEAFRRRNRLDYRIYEYARRQLDRDAQATAEMEMAAA